MITLETVEEMQAWAQKARAANKRVGFVPTMGFLHDGHRSLMSLLRERVDQLVVSVFVNPRQFGPGEDLARYPRDLPGDARLCEAEQVDVLFAPADLYGPGFNTRVLVEGVSAGLCAQSRPTHFEGVATVVARLFGLVQPTVAAFGEKDFQQLKVVQQLVRDLALPVQVVGGPIVREADGLALSSRNSYLTVGQRERAGSLYAGLKVAVDLAAAGETSVEVLRSAAQSVMRCDLLDYLELRAEADLAPMPVLDRPARMLVAGYFGKTRLIDNMRLGPA